ncbi:MAG: NAD(P)-dependent oxidoreductase, partial [Chloroflexota bacterium]
MSKTVLITGGAGSLGRALARQLAEAGHAVRAMDLPQCDFAGLEGEAGVSVLRGSISEPALLRNAARGVDVAVHLAALLPPASERDRARTWAVNVEGTRLLLEALTAVSPAAGPSAAGPSAAHLVFSSSVCVYGDT